MLQNVLVKCNVAKFASCSEYRSEISVPILSGNQTLTKIDATTRLFSPKEILEIFTCFVGFRFRKITFLVIHVRQGRSPVFFQWRFIGLIIAL